MMVFYSSFLMHDKITLNKTKETRMNKSIFGALVVLFVVGLIGTADAQETGARSSAISAGQLSGAKRDSVTIHLMVGEGDVTFWIAKVDSLELLAAANDTMSLEFKPGCMFWLRAGSYNALAGAVRWPNGQLVGDNLRWIGDTL